MTKNLKSSFFQVFTLSLIWITVLITVFLNDLTIPITYLWNVIGIAAIFGLMFGVLYSVLWNYLTLKPIMNILISSVLNLFGGLMAVLLFSAPMFYLIAPWIPGMLVLTIFLHTLAFYIYARVDAQKKAGELNELMKNKNEEQQRP
ncbi:hypothetical protein [Acetobacterium malicum]|uniref:DUF3021 domain-containing protein n=1 Tax=Acetobacterium malicum TaxID=52692 RepID=A0ABR6YZ10_9FIRM|nr:hypothetical protein [Acetobacterium malicum]MBC3900482.1 hypothetical protein [Acetobacterium malicum]